MAQKVTVTLVDDLDGEARADETVEFAIDGTNYEIDLSAVNAAKLRAELDIWITHARKITGRRNARSGGSAAKSKGARAGSEREQSGAIREWARQNGHVVSSRGRISAEITDAYHAAVGG